MCSSFLYVYIYVCQLYLFRVFVRYFFLLGCMYVCVSLFL